MERQIHNLIQGSPEWQAFRLEHDGASEAAAMLGLSKKTMRSELLRVKHTGIAKEFSDWVQANVLDYGHEVEAMARPLVEEIIGDELYPATYSFGRLSASCDGLTMAGDTAFEHKQWNAELAAAVKRGELPEEHQPQCQQVMHVTGAERLIFAVSDGTIDNLVWMEVLPDAAWVTRIAAGWAQFHRDLEAYVPPEIIPAAVAAPIKDLPTLFIQARGEVTKTNMPEFKAQITEFLGSINMKPATDQEFADGKEVAKKLRELAVKIKERKADMLAQTATIGEVAVEIDHLAEVINANALELEKAVKREEDARKLAIVADGRTAFADHIAALNTRLGKPYMPSIPTDFAEAIKGKRLITAMQDAVATLLANKKIEASAIADRIEINLNYLRETATEYRFLFSDTAQLVLKDADACEAIIKSRIAEHKAKEAARLEAETARIRAEEEAKAAAKSKAAQDEEDALIASIWNNANRIEGDSVSYVEKAINRFDSGDDLSRDPRPRVAAAFNEARMQMQKKLIAAKAKAEQDEAERLAIEQRAAAPATNTTATASQSAGEDWTKETPAPGTRETLPGPTLAQVLHAAAPAEIAHTMAPAVDTGATIKLGDINSLLGFAMTADFLGVLGFQPARTENAAKLYLLCNLPAICAAIARHVNAVAATAMQKAA